MALGQKKIKSLQVTALLLVRWGTTSYTSITSKLPRQNIIITTTASITYVISSSRVLA